MRLGLFGGTFDPPHTGHLLVAQDAAAALDLDRVVFVPAAQPPHKQGVVTTAAHLRARMLSLAIADDVRFTIDTLELDRPGPSYTIDTLRELRMRQPGDWTVLMGADQFAEFDTWREPDEILRIANVAVLERGDSAPAGGDSPLAEPDSQRIPRTPFARDTTSPLPFAITLQPGVLRVRVTRIDLSSTTIRARVAAGLPITYMVPPAIEAFIHEAGLYVRNGTSRAG